MELEIRLGYDITRLPYDARADFHLNAVAILNMADNDLVPFQLFIFLDVWLDDDIELIIPYNTTSTTTLLSLFKAKQRTFIPRIFGYVENIIPQFLEEDFVTHYRVSRTVFDEILQRITPGLLPMHGGEIEQITPQKQLLVFFWLFI